MYYLFLAWLILICLGGVFFACMYFRDPGIEFDAKLEAEKDEYRKELANGTERF